MYSVLVCGGRYYDDHKFTFYILDKLCHDCSTIITGTALEPDIPLERVFGADRLAVYWARKNNIECKIFEPDWAHYSKAAGPRRNTLMLNEAPKFVIAFPGGTGTHDTITKAKRRRIPVYMANREKDSYEGVMKWM